MRIYLLCLCIIWDGPTNTNAQNTTLSVPPAILGIPLTMSCEFTEATLGFTWNRRSNTSSFFMSVGSIYNLFNGSTCVPPDPEFKPDPTLYSFSCPGTSRQTLTVRNVTLGNHEDRWQCAAFPRSGGRINSNTVILSIQVHITKLEMSPKVDPVSLIANMSAQFTCISDFGRPTPSVHWFFGNSTNDDFDIVNITSFSTMTTVSENVTISTLTFMPSKTYHNMRLYCSGINGGPTVISTLKPLMNILFGPSKPEFKYNGSIVVGSITVLSGMYFLLTCKSSGNPPPSLTWTYPNGTAPGENLVISIMGTTHEGNYTCSSHNTMTTSIGSKRSETTYSSIFVQVNVPITHVEMVSPKSNIVFLKENDSTSFECVTSPGKPAAVIKWYKDNRTPENYFDDVEMPYSSVKSLPDNATKSVLNYTAQRGDDDMRIYCTGNNIGETLKSTRHATLIIASFPDAPSSIAVTEVTSTSVKVSLRYLSTGHMLQRYIIEVKEEDNEWIGQSVLAAFYNLSSSNVYIDQTMLKQSTHYSIRVYAENILGQSEPSDVASFTTLSVEAADLPNTSSQSFSVGAIIGSVVGGVIFGVFLGILGSWIVVIRRKVAKSQADTRPGPQITSEHQSGSDDAYSSIPPNPADINQRVNPSQPVQNIQPQTGAEYENVVGNEQMEGDANAKQETQTGSEHQSGSDDAYSSIPPNPADINQRVNPSQPVQNIQPQTGAEYENVVGNEQMEGDANAKQETQTGDLTTTAMYESLTHDHRGKEEYEMIKPSHK